jgi:hypothetical protein
LYWFWSSSPPPTGHRPDAQEFRVNELTDLSRAQVDGLSRIEPMGEGLTPEQKIKVLLELLGQMQSNRKDNEELEHKVAFAVTTLLIGLAAYVVKGDYVMTTTARGSLAFFSISISLLTIWFLLRNASRIRIQCKLIVRIEQALGLYEENLYISSEQVSKVGNRPYKEATIYPHEAQKYGEGDWALLLTPHILVILFAGVVACTVVLMDKIL